MWEGLSHKGDVFRKLLHKAKIRKRSSEGGGGREGEQPSPSLNQCLFHKRRQVSRRPANSLIQSRATHEELMQRLTVKAPRQ